MLLKCKQCGYENQIGSIFCRGCGAKIDNSALDPDSPDANNIKAADRKKKAIETFTMLLKRAVTCLILAFLIVTLCFLFADSHAPEYSAPADINTEELMKKIDSRQDIALSPEAMTVLFKENVMNNISESHGSYVPREVIFRCDEASKDILKIYIHTNIAGINTVCTLRGRLSRGNNGSILFDTLSVRLGKVNLPFAQETIMKNFDPVLKSGAVENFFRNARFIKFTNGELQIQYGI